MLHQKWLAGACAFVAAQALAGGLTLSAGEPYPYTEEWWALRATDPPGARQLDKKGKLWPPYPRPVGEKQHWVHKYHHAHYWPHPYNCDDQAFVHNILQQQTDGGWVSATTLRSYHFESDTQELNSVGRDHLQWIVTSTPPHYRTVYVAQNFVPAEDALRQANVEKSIREIMPAGGIPVILRPDRYQGRPAEEIDQLRRLELQSIPRPRLFVIGSANAGGGGGGMSSAQAGGTSGQSGLMGSSNR